MATAMYAVEGMMCESCMAAVLENVYSLSGVTVVAMDLVAGGQSPLIVTSGTKLGPDAVRDAVQHVGFGVPRPKRQEPGERGNSPASRQRGTRPDREAMLSFIGGGSS